MAFMFEKEAEELGDWFAKTFPLAEFDLHIGVNTTKKCEEYHSEVKIGNRHLYSSLNVPLGWEDQDKEFVEKMRRAFVDTQKTKITAAIHGTGEVLVS